MTNRLDAYPQSALRSFCEARLQSGGTLADARRQLEAALGRAIPSPLFYQYLNGDRRVSDDLRQLCIAIVLPDLIKTHGEDYSAILNRIR